MRRWFPRLLAVADAIQFVAFAVRPFLTCQALALGASLTDVGDEPLVHLGRRGPVRRRPGGHVTGYSRICAGQRSTPAPSTVDSGTTRNASGKISDY